MIIVRPDRCILDQPFIAPAGARSGDAVVFGAPHCVSYQADSSIGYSLSTRSADAPVAIRKAANASSSNIDHYDFDLGGPLFGDGRRRFVDAGDLKLSPWDGRANQEAIVATTEAILRSGAVPFLLGGDDSVPVPFLRSFADGGPVDVLQIDAHIDWRDRIGEERDGYSSTMRRASELTYVRSITQVGMRGVGSARPSEVADAMAWGARLLTVHETRRLGVEALVGSLSTGGRLVIQVDCDAFDPSVCPAVNAPTPGGFRFEELAALVRAAIELRGLAGFSLVELVPEDDRGDISATVAARLLLNAVGTLARRP
jgi:agmatinase